MLGGDNRFYTFLHAIHVTSFRMLTGVLKGTVRRYGSRAIITKPRVYMILKYLLMICGNTLAANLKDHGRTRRLREHLQNTSWF